MARDWQAEALDYTRGDDCWIPKFFQPGKGVEYNYFVG